METLIDPGDVPDIEDLAVRRLERAGMIIAPLACENVLTAGLHHELLDDVLPTPAHLRDALSHSIEAERLARLPEMVRL